MKYIYKTTNLINGKIYIGQTNGHRNTYIGGGKLLIRAIKKYGKHNFNKEVLVKGEFNQLFTDELEIHYIRVYNSNNLNIGYNLETGGMGGRNNKITEEERLKKSIAQKKRFESKEERQKMRISSTKAFTLERKERYSKIMIERNKNITQEIRDKISKANKAKIVSEKTKRKISESLKGKMLGIKKPRKF